VGRGVRDGHRDRLHHLRLHAAVRHAHDGARGHLPRHRHARRHRGADESPRIRRAGIRRTRLEPAVDLAVCCSIASSLLDKIIDNKIVLIGEVGLGGEIRSVGNIEKRIQEAEKLGFKKIYIPGNNLKNLKLNTVISIIGVNNVGEILQSVFK